MFAFIANLLHAAVPLALLLGLVPALGRDARQSPSMGAGVAAALIGVGLGLVAFLLATEQGLAIEARTLLRSVALLVLWLATAGLILSPALDGRGAAGGPIRGLIVGGALAALMLVGAQGGFDFLWRSQDQSLTATLVLNTELIVNLGALLVTGAGLIVLTAVVAHLGRRIGTAWCAGLLLVAAAGLSVAWIADIMLGLFQLDRLEVTRAALAFVAKVTNAAPVLTYGLLGLALAMALVFARGRRPIAPGALDGLPRPERRKLLSRRRGERQWLSAGAATAGAMVLALVYYDAYASRPPSISEPEPVTPGADGVVSIAIDEVVDGDLHRFSYVAGDGHLIRFFLINKLDEANAQIAVVLDVCEICPDWGYIKIDNTVMCLPCGSRVLIQTLGRPGGCNPIPLEHEVRDGRIQIRAAALDAGAPYFSTIVPVEVIDPVTGGTVVNTEAPHRYQYRGKQYYFEGRESYERFREDPERYHQPDSA